MVTIEDIYGIDNCDINSYSEYTHNKGYIDYPTGNEISYGSLSLLCTDLSINNTKVLNGLEMVKDHLKESDLFLISKYLQYGDYDNSCMVERSNRKLFLEDYEDLPGVFRIFGGYGSKGIAISIRYLLNPDNEEKAQQIIDLLNDLNDYPCIDDEDMSNMEYESFLESLNDYGIEDFISESAKKFNLDIYDYSKEKIKELILEIDRNLNYPCYEIESGGGCYIDIKRLIEPVTIEQLKPCLTDYEVVS